MRKLKIALCVASLGAFVVLIVAAAQRDQLRRELHRQEWANLHRSGEQILADLDKLNAGLDEMSADIDKLNADLDEMNADLDALIATFPKRKAPDSSPGAPD